MTAAATTPIPSVYLVRLDYTNGSAQIIDPAGCPVALYGPGVTRHTLDGYLRRDGWQLVPGGRWAITHPPDGREHPIHRDPRAETIALSQEQPPATPLDFDTVAGGSASDTELVERIVARFGPGTNVLGFITCSGPHPLVHRAEIAFPRRPCCGHASHGEPGELIQAVAVTSTDDPHAALEALTAINVELCRLCRRCWRSTTCTTIPTHSRSCFRKTR